MEHPHLPIVFGKQKHEDPPYPPKSVQIPTVNPLQEPSSVGKGNVGPYPMLGPFILLAFK